MSLVARLCSPPRLFWRCVHSGCCARLLTVLSWLTPETCWPVTELTYDGSCHQLGPGNKAMETLSDAVLSSWDLNPWVVISAAIFAILYGRGWWQLHRRAPDRFSFSQPAAFFAGLIIVVCALLSPLDAFAGWLLTVHMIQHLLLMMVAPPFILWGAPYLPLLSG